MKCHALAGLLVTSMFLTGCSRIEEAAMPIPAKVNAAHPPSPDVRLAQERLFTLLTDDAAATQRTQALVDTRMDLRALNCAKNTSIGRLDSVSDVRSRLSDASCFQEQDRDLQQFFGIRTIGVLLAKPALRPLVAAGPMTVLPKGQLSSITSGTLARDAGVGLLLDGRGAAAIVELPGAKQIAQLPRGSAISDHDAKLSPNGHVVAIRQTLGETIFFEAATGSRIWSVDRKGAPRLLAWLPEVDSFLLAGIDETVMLADGLEGSMEPHPLALRHTSYAAHLPGESPRVLMGTARELNLVEHVRAEQGVRASMVKQYNIGEARGITSGHPVPMRSGRMVVYASNRDIGWLDLESGAAGTWRTSPKFGIPFAKLDENRLAFIGFESGGQSSPWAFDLAAQTVAPIDANSSQGSIVDLGDRIGMLRRANNAWFGDEVTTGESQPLDKVMADYELQRELEKLATQSRLQELQAAEHRSSDDALRVRALPSAAIPGLAGVPADAQVHVIGVYEGRSPTAARNRQAPGQVRVLARPSNRPVVLVLASYESVNWTVINTGARISAILLSGYEPSTVVGHGSAPILRIGSAYAYSPGGEGYGSLRSAIARYTGAREVRSFQGNYTGSEFSVGGH